MNDERILHKTFTIELNVGKRSSGNDSAATKVILKGSQVRTLSNLIKTGKKS